MFEFIILMLQYRLKKKFEHSTELSLGGDSLEYPHYMNWFIAIQNNTCMSISNFRILKFSSLTEPVSIML